METHYLKITSKFFKMALSGRKQFEIRFNDCNFKLGDKIILKEIDSILSDDFTGQEIHAIISDIIPIEEVCPGYVILIYEVFRLENVDGYINGCRRKVVKKPNLIAFQELFKAIKQKISFGIEVFDNEDEEEVSIGEIAKHLAELGFVNAQNIYDALKKERLDVSQRRKKIYKKVFSPYGVLIDEDEEGK